MSGLYRSTDFFARVRWIGYGCALLFMGIAGFGLNFASNETTHGLAVASDLVRSLNRIETVAGEISLYSHSGHDEGHDTSGKLEDSRKDLRDAIDVARAQHSALPPAARDILREELGRRDFVEPLAEASSPFLENGDPGAHLGTGEAAHEHYFVETFLPATRTVTNAVEAVRQANLETLEFQGKISLGLMGFMLAAITLCIFVPMELAIGKTVRKLQDTRRKAEAAHQAKSDFLANMSHEIRTPMNGVMGMAKLLARSELNDKQKTFTDIIVKSGNALLTIINDVLDFSKIEAGEVTLDPEPFQLYEAVEDVATLVSAKADEKGLEIVVRIQPDLPEDVIGDAGRLRQILTNLVGNGVKFTDAGHVLIDVSGTVGVTDSGRVVDLLVKVTDTGIGIPEGDVAKVFEKFSQVDESSTRRHEGTGLGLTISQRLISLMGGEIGAQSVFGEGSTFWFSVSLPIEGEQKAQRTAPSDLKGAHMLVVDDNEASRNALTEQIASWGFNVDAADCGTAALNQLSLANDGGIPYELVLLDLDMPGMDGAEVARRIRSNPASRDTGIILLTSVDAPLKDIDYTAAEADEQLVKPMRSSDLFRSLTHALSVQRSDNPNPARRTDDKPDGGAGAQKGLRAAHRGTSGKVVQIAVGGDAAQQLSLIHI